MFATRVTKTSKRKKSQHIPVDTPVDDIQKKAMTNIGKRSKLDAEIEMFIKMEEDSNEDYNIKLKVKHKQKSTSKKGVTGKKQENKSAPVSQYPRRNSTRVTNKYMLKSKAMFESSIRKENVIVIEDHSEDSKAGVKEKEERPPLHKKPIERCKQIAQFPAGPVTRATTRLSRDEAIAKGTNRTFGNKESNPVDSDHISNIPEAMESTSSDDDQSSGLASTYQIKLREPKASIDLNKPAPAEEFPEFKFKIINNKEKIIELQRVVKQLKKEKDQVEKWSARQQERI